MAVEVAVEMAVEFQSGSRKKSGSRKAGHPESGAQMTIKITLTANFAYCLQCKVG